MYVEVILVMLILGNEGILYLYYIVNVVNKDLIRMNLFIVIFLIDGSNNNFNNKFGEI